MIIILIFVFDGEKEIDNNKENIVSQSLEEEYKENKEKEELVAAASVQEKVSNDAELILKKYYIQCEHTINETVELPQEIINMKRYTKFGEKLDDILKYSIGWQKSIKKDGA